MFFLWLCYLFLSHGKESVWLNKEGIQKAEGKSIWWSMRYLDSIKLFFVVFGPGTSIYHLNLWVSFIYSFVIIFISCPLNKSKATESSLAQAANSSSAQAARHSSAQAARHSSAKKAADDTDEEGHFSPADNGQAVSSTFVEAAKSSSAQAEKKKDSGGKKPPLYKLGKQFCNGGPAGLLLQQRRSRGQLGFGRR